LVRKKWEYEKIYRGGKRLHGEGFTLIYRMNPSGTARLGISVHHKIRGAVKRNRIKRLVREAFRLGRNDFLSGADMVFAVRPDFVCNSPGAIRQAVGRLTKNSDCVRGL
jgi:ribonuclease P protein component